MTLQLTSSAFVDGQAIPSKYTCQGDDVSPALSWSGVPEDVQSYALIMDDPDAPGRTWIHWVLYNLPADLTSLPEGATVGTQGENSWNRPGYGGPCPPTNTHHYIFKLYALDIDTDLDPNLTKNELLDAISGHIIGQGQLVGTYKKS